MIYASFKFTTQGVASFFMEVLYDNDFLFKYWHCRYHLSSLSRSSE